MADRRMKTEESKPDARRPVSSASAASTEHRRSSGTAASAPRTTSAPSKTLKFEDFDPAKQTLIRTIWYTDDFDTICQAFEDFKLSKTTEATLSGLSSNSGLLDRKLRLIRSRFSNFKRQLCDETGLKIHYWEKQKTITGEPNYCVRMRSRIGTRYLCPGTKTTPCTSRHFIDQSIVTEEEYLEKFKSFEFDHTYTQSYIRKSVKVAMDRCVEKAKKELAAQMDPSIGKWDLTYLKQNKVDIGLDNPENRLQIYVDRLIRRWIDVDKLREDLYGERVVVRCANCHNMVDEQKDHLPYAENRYYKN